MGRGLLQLLWLFQVLKRQEGCFCSLIRLVRSLRHPVQNGPKRSLGLKSSPCTPFKTTEDVTVVTDFIIKIIQPLQKPRGVHAARPDGPPEIWKSSGKNIGQNMGLGKK